MNPTIDLIRAIENEDITAASDALSKGGDVNCRITLSDDGMHYRPATKEECEHVLSQEQRLGGLYSSEPPIEYRITGAHTTTLLHYLAKKKSPNALSLATLLMSQGADLGAIDCQDYWKPWGDCPANYFQNTPLLTAIAENNLEFANAYLDALDRIEESVRRSILDYKDHFRDGYHTALEFAIRRGYLNLASRIVWAGADPNPRLCAHSKNQTPLHMAFMLLGRFSRVNKRDNSVTFDERLGSGFELIQALLLNGAKIEEKASITHTNAEGIIQRAEMTPLDHLFFSQDHPNAYNGPGPLSASATLGYFDSRPCPWHMVHPFHDAGSLLCPEAQRYEHMQIKDETPRQHYFKSVIYNEHCQEIFAIVEQKEESSNGLKT